MAKGKKAKKETVKVGSAAKAQEPEQAEETKPGKLDFPLDQATAEGGVAIELVGDDDAKVLSAVPFNWTPDHENLGRKAFATRSLYLKFQARKVDLQIVKLGARKADLLAKAEEAEKGVDPTQKKLRRAERLRAQLATLEAELEAEGIVVDEDED